MNRSEIALSGKVALELFDGRFLDFDPMTAERLDMLMNTCPKDMIPEVNRLLLSITQSRPGVVDVPNRRWYLQFTGSLGELLKDVDLKIGIGGGTVSLYSARYVKDEDQKTPRRRQNG